MNLSTARPSNRIGFAAIFVQFKNETARRLRADKKKVVNEVEAPIPVYLGSVLLGVKPPWFIVEPVIHVSVE